MGFAGFQFAKFFLKISGKRGKSGSFANSADQDVENWIERNF
jgi:hypothetical protein